MHQDSLWNNVVQCLRLSPLILILILILTPIPRTLIRMMTRAQTLVRLVLVIPVVEDDIALHQLVDV